MISKFADILLLSALWLICSIPLVTLGAATAALYDAAVKCVRGGEQASWRRFLRTFWQELVTATIVTVIWGAALLGMVWILRVLWAGGLADIGGAAGIQHVRSKVRHQRPAAFRHSGSEGGSRLLRHLAQG